MIYFNSAQLPFHLHQPEHISLNPCYLIRLINNKPTSANVWRFFGTRVRSVRSDNYLRYTRKKMFNIRSTLAYGTPQTKHISLAQAPSAKKICCLHGWLSSDGIESKPIQMRGKRFGFAIELHFDHGNLARVAELWTKCSEGSSPLTSAENYARAVGEF